MRTGAVIFFIVIVLIGLALIQRGNRRAQERINRMEERADISESVAERVRAANPGSNSQRMIASLPSGEHEFKIGSRKYLLYVPAGYDASQAVPLVLFFHGGGGDMKQAAADYNWEEKADQEGAAVAFLNGSSRFPRENLATWNAGSCCGYARDQEVDDVGFTRQVVTDIQGKLNIDTGKIFATGMSNGGMMSHRLACEMADVFAAVASVAGTDGTSSCSPDRPISVMHVHAKDDDHVLFDGGAGDGGFKDESKVTDFISVEETIKRWVARNRANGVPVRVLDVPGAYAELYTSKENAAAVELVVTETGGHSWPGGRTVRGKVPSRAIIANDVIWDFFKAHPKSSIGQ